MQKSKKQPNVKVITDFPNIKIYIDNLLHLCIDKSSLVGMQSWIMGESNTYFIEWTFKTTVVKSEYASKGLWEKLLTEIDKNVF